MTLFKTFGPERALVYYGGFRKIRWSDSLPGLKTVIKLRYTFCFDLVSNKLSTLRQKLPSYSLLIARFYHQWDLLSMSLTVFLDRVHWVHYDLIALEKIFFITIFRDISDGIWIVNSCFCRNLWPLPLYVWFRVFQNCLDCSPFEENIKWKSICSSPVEHAARPYLLQLKSLLLTPATFGMTSFIKTLSVSDLPVKIGPVVVTASKSLLSSFPLLLIFIISGNFKLLKSSPAVFSKSLFSIRYFFGIRYINTLLSYYIVLRSLKVESGRGILSMRPPNYIPEQILRKSSRI